MSTPTADKPNYGKSLVCFPPSPYVPADRHGGGSDPMTPPTPILWWQDPTPCPTCGLPWRDGEHYDGEYRKRCELGIKVRAFRADLRSSQVRGLLDLLIEAGALPGWKGWPEP